MKSKMDDLQSNKLAILKNHLTTGAPFCIIVKLMKSNWTITSFIISLGQWHF